MKFLPNVSSKLTVVASGIPGLKELRQQKFMASMGYPLRLVFQKGEGTSDTITEALFRLIAFLSGRIDAKSGEIAWSVPCSIQVPESSFILRTNMRKPQGCSMYRTPKPGEVETVARGTQETSSTPMEKPRKDT